MTVKRRSIMLIILALGACADSRPADDTGPPSGLTESWALSDCAPWDGPATMIYFADSVRAEPREVSYPHLWLSLYLPAQSLLGRTFQWGAGKLDVGGAMWCPGPTSLECLAATAARVEIDDLPWDSAAPRISGRIDISFPDRDPVRGTFQARWLPHEAICG